MTRPRHPIIVIPARMQASRLPGKPLADIHGLPMIAHVWRRAVEADLGPVVVACAEPEIQRAIEAVGGQAVLTTADLPSGSDRVHEALERVDPDRRHDAVINVQGDLPTLDPVIIQRVFAPLADPAVDMASLVCEITEAGEATDPNVVKVAVSFPPDRDIGRALYFSRATIPHGEGPLYHHIGLYAFHREALTRFVGLAPGILERREKLEQLRALENGMRIDVARVDTVPLGVDTPAHLDRARALLAPSSSS